MQSTGILSVICRKTKKDLQNFDRCASMYSHALKRWSMKEKRKEVDYNGTEGKLDDSSY